jgi:hypothetical protein
MRREKISSRMGGFSMEAKDFSRRSFLKISAGALAGMALLSVPRAPRAMAAAPETSKVRLVASLVTK